MSETKKEYEYLNARGDKTSWAVFGTVGLIGLASIIFLNKSGDSEIPALNNGSNPSPKQYTNSGVIQNLMKKKNTISPAE